MPQSGLYGFPTDAIVLNQIFDSGSGRFKKPQGLIGKHTVIARAWGAGAGGQNGSPFNVGAGGGFNQRSFPYEIFPVSVAFVVGAGGTTGVDGGESYIAGDGVDVAASGGIYNGDGGKPGFRYGTSTIVTFDIPQYRGGSATGTKDAIWGGAAGDSSSLATRPGSIHGGLGSWYDGAAGRVATGPGGGGSTTALGAGMDVGGNGRVQFIIVRGIVPDLMGNLF